MNICSMYALGSKASFTKVCFNAYEEFYIFKVNVIGPLRFKASQPLVNNYKYSYITICKKQISGNLYLFCMFNSIYVLMLYKH